MEAPTRQKPFIDPRLGVAGRKMRAAERHEVTAARFRSEAFALRAEVEREQVEVGA
jgi:hypothetical protein